jgi:prophage regulatory protein
MNNREYISDKFLAERYEVSRNTIWRWARAGRLPKPVKFGERITRWRLDDVLASEAKQQPA